MKKNTLFVSLVAGFGSLAAVFAVLNNGGEAQYSSREMDASATASKVNSEFFSEMRKNVKTGKVEAADYINAVQSAKFAKSSSVFRSVGDTPISSHLVLYGATFS